MEISKKQPPRTLNAVKITRTDVPARGEITHVQFMLFT